MSAPLLTRDELYRPGVLDDRETTDRWLAQDAMALLSGHAIYAARTATVNGQPWPDWVTAAFAYQCERRDRLATRRELHQMAWGGAR